MKHVDTICPIKKVADLLSDTWTILIIRDVLSSDKHFCELEKSLAGISTRTLTLKLKTLITKGILEKKDTSYTMTKKGKKLQSVVNAMRKISDL